MESDLVGRGGADLEEGSLVPVVVAVIRGTEDGHDGRQDPRRQTGGQRRARPFRARRSGWRSNLPPRNGGRGRKRRSPISARGRRLDGPGKVLRVTFLLHLMGSDQTQEMVVVQKPPDRPVPEIHRATPLPVRSPLHGQVLVPCPGYLLLVRCFSIDAGVHFLLVPRVGPQQIAEGTTGPRFYETVDPLNFRQRLDFW